MVQWSSFLYRRPEKEISLDLQTESLTGLPLYPSALEFLYMLTASSMSFGVHSLSFLDLWALCSLLILGGFGHPVLDCSIVLFCALCSCMFNSLEDADPLTSLVVFVFTMINN